MARVTIASVTAERDRFEAEASEADAARRQVVREFDAFKQKVREKAIEVAEEENWCHDGLNDALSDLGLPEVRKPQKEIRFVVEYRAYATLNGEPGLDEDGQPVKSWVEKSFSEGDLKRGNVKMDEDWLDFEIVEVEGLSVHEISDQR